ncbi:MAG: hypothetical protein ACXIT4_12210 [Erythrobacter sp.]
MKNSGYLAVLAAAGVLTAAVTTASAQGTMQPMPKPTNGSCPSGWTDYASEAKKSGDLSSGKGNTCYPKTSGAKPAYLPSPSSAPCADGYIKSGSFCVQGSGGTVQATAGSVRKANPLDRCPVGYFTDPGNGHMCTSLAASPPVIRLKGEGACAAGELEDWGVWCVSNYEGLTRKDAAKGYPDHNGIYQTSFKTTGKQQASRMADLPEGKEYTPAYFLIFGRVDRDGNPIGGGASAGATSGGASMVPAAASAEAGAAKACTPKPKKKGLGGLGKALGNAVGVDIPDGDGC